MQTTFTPEQLQDPHVDFSEKILRKCVHCGFCTATCPTYLTLGDELDSPRGRIYLIKDMLENDKPADEKIVKHIDRCLSCLACTTTCPSGVDYMHLVDHARIHIQETYKRPIMDRMLRKMLAMILPYPSRFRLALQAARLAKPFGGLIANISSLKPIAAMLALAPTSLPAASRLPTITPATDASAKAGRVAMLSGCAQQVLDPGINAATVELLTRLNVEIVVPEKEGCCGALVHHMGHEEASLQSAKNNIDVWWQEIENGGLDAIIITTSGCGTTVKDYGHMLRLDPDYAEKAKTISALARDITEYLSSRELEPTNKGGKLKLAYHSACSMQHGQKIKDEPKQLLENVGFDVVDIPEGHLCCGSAGTYNILQSEIAGKLKQRKLRNIARVQPDLIAAGNIGCLTQLSTDVSVPMCHTVELLNWAYGGAIPRSMEGLLKH